MDVIIFTFLIIVLIILGIHRFRAAYVWWELARDTRVLLKKRDPYCTKDQSADICQPFRGAIATTDYPDPSGPPDVDKACVLLGKFFHLQDQKNLPAEIKPIWWTFDSLPMGGVNNNTIMFRGTRTVMDTLVDLKAHQYTIGPGIKVHKGCYKMFKKLKAQIWNQVQPGPVQIMGHSLGTGLAILTAYYLALEDPTRLITVYCFAPFRLGNKAFSQAFNSNVLIQNYWNLADLIPATPPSYWAQWGKLLQYHHTGELFVFQDQRNSLVGCHALETYCKNLGNLQQVKNDI